MSTNVDIDTKSITSFSEYLDTLSYAENLLLKRNSDDYVIYRGQSVDKNLFPKLGRLEYDVPNRVEVEKNIVSEFRRLSFPHLQNIKLNDWDLLAIAQHYFLPTRLLDWSGNPLIALWFAVFNQPSESPSRVVWCYSFKQSEIVNCETGGPFSQTSTLVYQPKHISNRIVTQNGWFTSHYYKASNNKYTALNVKKGAQTKLFQIRISIDENEDRKSILTNLDTYGINSYSIFNDLEGLCQYLDWKTYKKK